MPARATALGPGSLKFGDTGSEQEFASQVTVVRLEPSYDAEDNIPVLSGEEIAGAETETWTLTGEFLQEFGIGNLVQWCFDNSGEELPFTFRPRTDGQLSATGTALIRAVSVGGDVKAKNTAEFEFKVVGRPAVTTTEV